MSPVGTTIGETMIHMRYADSPDPAKASGWIDFSVPLGELAIADARGDIPLGDIHTRQLATIQLAALSRVRDAINAEIQRLSGLSRA
jgi:hypothetical protein